MHSFIMTSFTSGGRHAFRILFVPIPAIFTWEISPFSCLYSSWPPVDIYTSFICSSLENLIYTLLVGPSIWIMRTSSSNRKLSCIHSWMLYAVILGLLVSKLYIMVFCLSLMFTVDSLSLHNTPNSPLRSHSLNLELTLATLKHSLPSTQLNADWFDPRSFQARGDSLYWLSYHGPLYSSANINLKLAVKFHRSSLCP